MKTRPLLIPLLTLAVGSLPAPALSQSQGAATARPAAAAQPVLTNRVFVGECVSEALADKQESALVAGIVAAVAPALISKGLDAIGAALTKLGEKKVTPVSATATVELSAVGERPTCVQFVRGRVVPSPGLGSPAAFSNYVGGSAFTAQEQFNLAKAQIYLAEAPEFFLEYWVRRSDARSAVSFTPTLLKYPVGLDGARKASGTRALTVTLSVETVTGGKGAKLIENTSFVLGDYPVGANVDFFGTPPVEVALGAMCDKGCLGASSWLPNPLPSGASASGRPAGDLAKPATPASTTPAQPVTPVEPGAGAKEKESKARATPSTWSMTVSETRDPNAFFKAVSAVYTAAKPTLKTELENTLIEQKREEAAIADIEATAKAQAEFASKLTEANAKLDAYCKAPLGSSVSARNARRAAALALSAAQARANNTASQADEPAPFPSLVPRSDVRDESLCA